MTDFPGPQDDGETELTKEEREGLIPSYITLRRAFITGWCRYIATRTATVDMRVLLPIFFSNRWARNGLAGAERTWLILVKPENAILPPCKKPMGTTSGPCLNLCAHDQQANSVRNSPGKTGLLNSPVSRRVHQHADYHHVQALQNGSHGC